MSVVRASSRTPPQDPDGSGVGPARRLLAVLLADAPGPAQRRADDLLVAALADHAPQARRPDGTRSCPLTPTGAPFEASFSLGRRSVPDTVRFCAVAGTGHPFFTAQLRTQRQVGQRAAAWLSPVAASRWTTVSAAMLDALYPTPWTVPARTRLVTALGVVLGRGDADILGLRLYANASLDRAAVDRLIERDPAFGTVVGATARYRSAVHLTAIEVANDAAVGRRLYSWAAPLVLLDAWPGDDATLATMRRVLTRAGLPRAVLGEPAIVCLDDDGNRPPSLTVHLRARALARHGVAVAVAVRRLAEQTHQGLEVVDRWAQATAATGWPWRYSIVGVGVDGDGLAKLNVYLAPEADRG